MSGPSGDEVAAVYNAAADRIAQIASSLDDAQLATPVPATPMWTVIELLSHVVGGPADVCAGNLDGVASDPWTQAQVEARRGRSVGELLEEWSGLREQIDGVCRSGMAPALAFDVATHEQDLRGALGLERIPDVGSIDLVASGLAAGAVGRSCKAQLPALQIRDEDGWSVGEPGGVTLTASKFELFRLLMGRRSAGQATAMSWSGDPAPYLGLLCPFGALRDTDVAE